MISRKWFFLLGAVAVAIILSVTALRAEMRVTLKDGRTMSLPINSSDIQRIEFSSVETFTPVSGRQCSWSGVWDTKWGEMILTQTRRTVSGEYTHDSGRISGKISGNQLKGSWSEAPTYTPNKDAGTVKFIMSSDCVSFKGKWRYGTSGKWKSWTGRRR